jgi:hypothetical protein
MARHRIRDIAVEMVSLVDRAAVRDPLDKSQPRRFLLAKRDGAALPTTVRSEPTLAQLRARVTRRDESTMTSLDTYAERAAMRDRLAKQAESRGPGVHTEPQPAPNRRFAGDDGVLSDDGERFTGDDDIDEENEARLRPRTPQDTGTAMAGEGEASAMKSANLSPEQRSLLGGDRECLRKEDRIAAIRRGRSQLRGLETGSPITNAEIRNAETTLDAEERRLMNEVQLSKSQGARSAEAKHASELRSPATGVRPSGPLGPAHRKPYSLGGRPA